MPFSVMYRGKFPAYSPTKCRKCASPSGQTSHPIWVLGRSPTCWNSVRPSGVRDPRGRLRFACVVVKSPSQFERLANGSPFRPASRFGHVGGKPLLSRTRIGGVCTFEHDANEPAIIDAIVKPCCGVFFCGCCRSAARAYSKLQHRAEVGHTQSAQSLCVGAAMRQPDMVHGAGRRANVAQAWCA